MVSGRDAWVLAACAVVVVVAATARRSAPGASASVAPSSAPPSIPALPTGATTAASPAVELAPGCSFPDPGFGRYSTWRPLPLGRALVPEGLSAGAYRLLVHFHGAEPARKLLAPAELDLVVVGVDAGTSSSHYERALDPAGGLSTLIASVDAVVSATLGAQSRASSVGLSAWSAGYGAVRTALSAPDDRVRAVILLDGLHAGYDANGAPERARLLPFLELARAAMAGRATLLVTHGEVRTNGYASTRETASFLLKELGLDDSPGEIAPDPSAAAGEPTRLVASAGLHVRGFRGGTREDHCAHLRMLRPAVEELVLPALDAAQ